MMVERKRLPKVSEAGAAAFLWGNSQRNDQPVLHFDLNLYTAEYSGSRPADPSGSILAQPVSLQIPPKVQGFRGFRPLMLMFGWTVRACMRWA